MDHAAAHRGAQAVHVAGSRDRDDVDLHLFVLAHALQNLQTAHVGQVDVEQYKVRLQEPYALQGLAAGVRAPDDLEAPNAIDVRAVQIGDAEVVVDDKGADHWPAATFSGTRTVKRAPPLLMTATSPPLRRAT